MGRAALQDCHAPPHPALALLSNFLALSDPLCREGAVSVGLP